MIGSVRVAPLSSEMRLHNIFSTLDQAFVGTEVVARVGNEPMRCCCATRQFDMKDVDTEFITELPLSSTNQQEVMCSKTEISFLLNPQSVVDDQSAQMIPTVYPQSPDVSATYHGSCIIQTKKTGSYDRTKMFMPTLSLNLLCSSTCSGEEFPTVKVEEKQSVTTPETQKTKSSRKRVRKNRTPPCKINGCNNITVSRGCCVRHGGGSRCIVDGCPNRAKLYKKCFHHGGFNTCATEGCTRKAKRYGHCWSHGGGRICHIPGCQKVSTQNDLCWAHGGGNRCKLEGCSRRSYLKYGYFCVDHASLRCEI